jgi:hypothetical protein
MAGALFGDAFPTGASGSRDLTGTGDTTKYAMGTHWRPQVAGTVSAVRWFVPSSAAPTNADFAVGLVKANAAGLGSGTTWLDWNTGVTRPGAGAQGTWVSLPLSAPVSVAAGDELYVVVRTDRYAFAQHMFDSVSTFAGADGNTTLVGDGVGGAGFPNGGFATGGAETPNPPNFSAPSSFAATFYGVDVVFTPASGNATATPSTVAPPAVTIGTPTLTKGTTATPSLVAPPAVTIGTPTIGTGSSAKATPALVQAAVSIPTPTVIVPLSATATPARVNGAVSVPRPLIFAGVQWSLWDGLRETVLTLDGAWNGVSIDPLTFDEVLP